MKTNLGDDDTPVVDMAPMIDCVFLLLIFFLIVATIRKKHNELPIVLPEPGTSAQTVKPTDDTLIISMYKLNGKITFGITTKKEQLMKGQASGGNEGLDLDKFRKILKEKAAENTSRPVRIDADESIKYGKIMEIIDTCRLYQIEKIGLRTADPAPSAQ